MDDLMLLLGLSPVGGKLVVARFDRRMLIIGRGRGYYGRLNSAWASAAIGLGGKNVRAKQLIQRVEHLGCRSG